MDDIVDPAVRAKMQLVGEQARIISGVERAGATLSLIGVFLVIITFILFKRLRTVPNTFILFASIANIGASVASLIGLAGIDAGTTSPLCLTQAFLLEMFMQSDPWWSFAMAVNVFMVFFFSASPHTFRRYLWVYCVICFGVPMVPAIVCLALNNRVKGPVYGNATLWCWIGDNWNSLRIFSYYIPIWVCIVLSALIYLAVGYQVFHQRNQLRNLTLSNQAKETSSSDVRDSGEKNAHTPAYYGTVTTEVEITTDTCNTIATTSAAGPTPPPTPAPSANIPCPGCPWATSGPLDDPLDLESGGGGGSSNAAAYATATVANITTTPSKQTSTTATSTGKHHPTSSDKKRTGRFARVKRAWHRFARKLRNTDPVKLAYLRTSFVFAISVLVTWTPSSINRVYTLMHPTQVSYALNVASAAVLPLQGVWNAVIYFTTSWRTMKAEVKSLCERRGWFHYGSRRRARGARVGRVGGRGSVAGAFRMGSLGQADRFEARAMSHRRGMDSTELELAGRGGRMGTVRVQKGGELDI